MSQRPTTRPPTSGPAAVPSGQTRAGTRRPPPTPAYPLHDAVPYGPVAYEPAPYGPGMPYQPAAYGPAPYVPPVHRLPRRPRGYDPLTDTGRHHRRLAPAGW